MTYIVATPPGFTNGYVRVFAVFEDLAQARTYIKHRPGLAIYPEDKPVSEMTFDGECYMVPGYTFDPKNERWFR